MKFEPRAVEDIAQTMEAFSDMIPSYINHQFPDGIVRPCISLKGTIPINYKVFLIIFKFVFMAVFF